jgi:hypothetical protein
MSANLADGLLAYYKMNGNGDDSSGNGNHATVHGTGSFDASDQVAGTHSLRVSDVGLTDLSDPPTGMVNGRNAFECPMALSLQGATAITVSAWVKSDGLASGDWTGDQHIVTVGGAMFALKAGDSGGSNFIWQISDNMAATPGATGPDHIYCDTNNANSGKSRDHSYFENEWIHVVGTFDLATRSMVLYVNGVPHWGPKYTHSGDGTDDYIFPENFVPSGHGTNIPNADPAEEIYGAKTIIGNNIGHMVPTSANDPDPWPGEFSFGDRFWNGLIDEVRIYDRSLDIEEVTLLHVCGRNGKESDAEEILIVPSEHRDYGDEIPVMAQNASIDLLPLNLPEGVSVSAEITGQVVTPSIDVSLDPQSIVNHPRLGKGRGLIAFYELDETSLNQGDPITDACGNWDGYVDLGESGVLASAAGPVSGSSSIDFDGAIIRMANDMSVTGFTDALTIAAFVKFDDQQVYSDSWHDNQCVVHFGHDKASLRLEGHLKWGSCMKTNSDIDGNSNSEYRCNHAPRGLATLGSKWYHVAMVYDGNSVYTYVNGAKVGQWTNYGWDRPAGWGAGDWASIGGYFTDNQWNGVVPRLFYGAISKVGVWNRGLSPKDISDLYKYSYFSPTNVNLGNLDSGQYSVALTATGGGDTFTTTHNLDVKSLQDGLVAYYPFNDNENDFINNYHGIPMSGASIDHATKKVGSGSMHFGGPDDPMVPHEIEQDGDTISLSGTDSEGKTLGEILGNRNDISVSFWLKPDSQPIPGPGVYPGDDDTYGTGDDVIRAVGDGTEWGVANWSDGRRLIDIGNDSLYIEYQAWGDIMVAAHTSDSQSPPSSNYINTNQRAFVKRADGEAAELAILNEKWIHVVGINDGGTLKLYTNSVMGFHHVGHDNPFVPDGELPKTRGNVSKVHIGSDVNRHRYFIGNIDDVGFYDRALRHEEVEQIFWNGESGLPLLFGPTLNINSPQDGAQVTVLGGDTVTFGVSGASIGIDAQIKVYIDDALIDTITDSSVTSVTLPALAAGAHTVKLKLLDEAGADLPDDDLITDEQTITINAVALDTGLQVYFPFKEDVEDKAGGGFTHTLLGEVNRVPIVVNDAEKGKVALIKWNGTEGGGIDLDPASIPIGSSGFTMAFWSKVKPWKSEAQTTLVQATSNAGGVHSRILNIHMPWDNGNVYFDVGATGHWTYDRAYGGATGAELQQWIHWTVTRNFVTGSMVVYRNGVSWLTSTGNTGQMMVPESFVFGNGPTPAHPWVGWVSELSISDRALTAAEVAHLAQDNPIKDVTPPHIMIAGDNPTVIKAGDVYSDAGASAVDLVDGDVAVVTSGLDLLSPSEAGTYFVTYDAEDAVGNQSTAQRTVEVLSLHQHPEDDTTLDFGAGDDNGWSAVGYGAQGNTGFYAIDPGDDAYLIAAAYWTSGSQLEKAYITPYSHNYARIKFRYYYIHDTPDVSVYADGVLVHTVNQGGEGLPPSDLVPLTHIDGSVHPWSDQFYADIDVLIPHTGSSLTINIVSGGSSGHRRSAISPVEIYLDNPAYELGFAKRDYVVDSEVIGYEESTIFLVNGEVIPSDKYTLSEGVITFDSNILELGDIITYVKVE